MALRSSTDRVALLKIEASYGVAPAMAAGDAILLMESNIEPMADKLDRVIDRPFFGGDPFVLVGKRITLTATCDLLGNAAPGTAAPLGGLYRICGHSETLDAVGPPPNAVYAPISTGVASGTVDFYWAGVLFRMTGVRGMIDFDFTIKNFGKGKVQLTGLLTMPADGEAPGGISWAAFQTPAPVETETWEVIVDSVNVNAQQLTLNQGSTVTLVEGSEGREVAITQRKPTGVLRVFKDATLATWNPWDIANDQAVITLENSITKAAGLNLVMPILAQLEFPKPVDIEGVAGFEIPFTAVPTGAGGDEYLLDFQ